MTEQVSITSRHVITCANELSWTALPSPFLGPLDQLVAPVIPVAVVFIYQPDPTTPDVQIIPIERLKRALERLLDYYPSLTGRLQVDPNDGTADIAHLGNGAELIEGQCGKPLNAFTSSGQITMAELPGGGNALLPPFDMSMEGVCRDPIFTVQHTRFACGGVALGIRILHTVCDADGFFQLVRDLAELYRGIQTDLDVPSLTRPPNITPALSGGMSPEELQSALCYQPSLFYVDSDGPASVDPENVTASSIQTASTPVPPPVTGRFMRFSSRTLDTLKTHTTDPNLSGSWVSTFDALSALLHRSVYRARVQLRANDSNYGNLSPPDFLTPINVRLRLPPDVMSPPYFHNALLTVYTSFSVDLLASGPLSQVAKVIHDLTRSHATSAREVEKTLRWIAAQPNKRSIKQGFRYGNGSLMISQWNKMDAYTGTTFDAPPVLVLPPFTSVSLMDGLGYFMSPDTQGEVEDKGAIVVCLALSDPVWSMLEQDEEFCTFYNA